MALTKTYSDTPIAERACAITVASAAPATPKSSARIKTRSSTILVTAAAARKSRGTTVLPMLLRTDAKKLYMETNVMPAKMW